MENIDNSSKRQKVDKKSSLILEEWLHQHDDYPYPEKHDLDYLTKVTNLSNRQVRIWFTNYRNVSFLLES